MGIGIKELLIILVIIVLLFGTKRLKSLGSDLGAAIKGFKKSMTDEEQALQHKEGETIDGQAQRTAEQAKTDQPPKL
jgi:sec-independent protein translocase protein TatA